MGLRIFPVVGEALNFGGRRMATITRVAWLPVALLLIVNMATVFAYLSVIAGRVITFAEMGTFISAQQALLRFAARGWTNNFEAMATVTAGSVLLNTILIAAFVAPLIRLSGLGEKPAPGIVRLAFGPDQIRYIVSGLFSFLFVALIVFAPMIVASFYALKYIIEAMSQTMASFPDPESLHTIELVTVGENLVAGGAAWVFNLAIPLAVVAPFAIILWVTAFAHFHPRNRPHAPSGGQPAIRALITLTAVGVIAGGAFIFIRQQILNFAKSAAAFGGDAVPDFSGAPENLVLFFGVTAYLLATYVNLRLYPYPGVAVCRKSLALGNTLRVSRGWNIIRLQTVLFALSLFLIFVQVVIINFAMLSLFFPLIVTLLHQAVSVTTRLLNSGVTAEWVWPLFIWIWNGTKIFINVIWIFFSYGVVAGLYGALYKESERDAQRA